jgi:hypothetical protein
MLQLDHLAIIARSLAEGIEHVRACLDIDMPNRAIHAEEGAELRDEDTEFFTFANGPSAAPTRIVRDPWGSSCWAWVR